MKIKENYGDHVYTVYGTRTVETWGSPETQFLIYAGMGWQWVGASNYQPYEEEA